MGYFILVWTCLTIICVVIGTALLNIVRANCFDSRSNYFIAAFWLGLIILCIALLATSLILPLSTAVGAAIAFGLNAFSLLSYKARTTILKMLTGLTPGLILGFFVLAMAVALLITPEMTWFDTGVYHLGAIKWLSEFGAVPGVSLINPKFGFTSSWFALAAPLTPKVFGNRIGAITNGFIFLIAIVQLLICLIKILDNKARLSDWFLLSFFSIVISVYTLKISTSPIVVSFTADIAITFLIGITAWFMLIISGNHQSSYQSSIRQTNICQTKPSPLDARIIPLILSCGAVTLKLSAFALLPAAFLYYVCDEKISIQRVIWGIATVIVLLLPMLSFGVITSGCPLYPSTLMCLDTPWLVTEQQANVEAGNVQFWWKLVDEDISGFNYLILGFLRWLQGSINSQIMIVLIVLSFILAIQILRLSNDDNFRGYIWLITIGFLGMSFIMIQGPLIRFGLGYFILISSLSLARYGQLKFAKTQSSPTHPFSLLRQWRRPSKLILLGSLLLLGSTGAMVGDGKIQSRLLLPPELPNVNIEASRVNDIEYVYPLYPFYKACWASKLPCAPSPIEQNIKLRKPSQGLGAGFIQAK